MDFLTNAYSWFWYHTEFWLKPKDRRPFTFIMRDFYHQYPFLVLLLTGAGFYALGNWGWHLSVAIYFVILGVVFAGIVLGHLFWGRPYVKGEQETPEYIEPEDKGT